MSTIDVENYRPDDFVPRGIVNLVEGRRLPSAAEEPRRVCLVGVSSFPPSGPEDGPLAPADMPVRVLSERPTEEGASGTSAEELFGAGSELTLMCRAAFQAFPGVELWGVPIVEPPEPEPPTEEDPWPGRARAELTVTGTARRVGEWTIVIHDTPVPVRIEDEAGDWYEDRSAQVTAHWKQVG